MTRRAPLVLTALCLAELGLVVSGGADPWDVDIRPLGLPESGEADAPIRPRPPRVTAQQRFAAAIAVGDLARAGDIAARVDDAALARDLGWSFFNARQPAPARDWFERSLAIAHSPEAAYGAALAAFTLDDLDGAEAALAAVRDDAEFGWDSDALAARVALRRGWRALDAGDVAHARRYASIAADMDSSMAAEQGRLSAAADLNEAQRAYADNAFARARQLARAAARDPALTQPARRIEAWAALRSGDGAARDLFDALYRETRDEESAQGLMLAYEDEPAAPALRALAGTAGPLRDLVWRRDADSAFARNDFLTAAAHVDYQAPLTGVASPWLQGSARYARRDGEPGQDHLALTQSVLSIGGARGRHLLAVDIGFTRADAGGAPAPGAVGTLGIAPVFAPTTNAELWTPLISWRREGALSPSATLGASPIGGEVSPRAIGALSMRLAGTNGEAQAGLFARGRSDSLLAAAGLRDPATGRVWGGIVEYGVETFVRRQLPGRLNFSASASASALDGARTRDNTRWRMSAGLSRDLGLAGFEYVALGPFYGFEANDHNLNGYTFGNGGYFSPQRFHRAGVSLNLQTEEARQLVIRADAAIAYEDIYQDGLDVLPLDSADPFGVGSPSRERGLSGALNVSAAYRLDRRVSLVGHIGAIRSAEFESFEAGLALSYSFADRATVTSQDLAQAPFGRMP